MAKTPPAMSTLTSKTNGHGASVVSPESSAPEPLSPTGQYPGPIWINGNGHAGAQTSGCLGTTASADSADAPEPPSATGQYPDPVWATGNAGATASAWTRSAAGGDENVPEPPSAAGQYPDPVWLTAQAQAQIRRPTSPVARAASGELPENLPASLKEADYTDDLGGALEPQPVSADTPAAALTNEAIYRIIREVSEADSGDALYAAVSADREFETAGHPAHQQRRFGLGFGLVLFTQESGRLGRVLRLMRQRDAQAFAESFGPDADALLAVTNAATPEQRLLPVGDESLWSARWIERFQRAGALPACQFAQNEEAIEGLFRPMLKFAAALGVTSDRGLAMMFDRVIARGLGGGLRWVAQAAGPLRTEAQRLHALRTLGDQDVRQFQAATAGLPQDGALGVETYAALVVALRQQGALPLPSTHEYVCRLVAAATGAARRRLLRLRDSAVLTDVLFQLP